MYSSVRSKISELMDSRRSSCRVVMLPWLAHGHIFPYLELSERLLKHKNFHIHLCTTAVNFTSINTFIHKKSLQNSIEVAELHLEPNPLLPPHHYTTKNLPEHLNTTLIKAFQTARSSFSDILASLKPDLVIYDVFQPWAPKLCSTQGNIPAVYFSPFGAATVSFVYHYYTCPNGSFPFPELSLEANEKRKLDDLMEFLHVDVFDQDKDIVFVNHKLSYEVVMLKTTRGLEAKYVNYVSSKTHKRILAVGPLVTEPERNEGENSDILQWLSEKDEHSTIYISFGSECFLSEEEIEEIAKGLELCGVNFIWVLRFPIMENTISVEEALPRGFLDRTKDQGRVVSGWAPQAEILVHPSTGAFMSHCGWSSLNESLYYGVPVIGMPMKVNMFVDAKMLVDAGACVEVVRDGNGAYKGQEIARAINEVMVEKTGQGMRLRARELGDKMRLGEGQAIREAAQCLWQICCKNDCEDYS